MNLSLAVILGEEMFCVIPLSFRLTTGWQSSLVEVDSVPAPATSDGESTPRVTWPTTWRRSRYSCTTTTAWHSYKSGGRSQYTGHNQVSSQHGDPHISCYNGRPRRKGGRRRPRRSPVGILQAVLLANALSARHPEDEVISGAY